MADPPSFPDSPGDTVAGQDRVQTGTPRWVKVFGIIALFVIVAFVIVLLGGGGSGHGPARHTSSGAPASGPPVSSAAFSVTGDPSSPQGGH